MQDVFMICFMIIDQIPQQQLNLLRDVSIMEELMTTVG